jgi:hypothetical protein
MKDAETGAGVLGSGHEYGAIRRLSGRISRIREEDARLGWAYMLLNVRLTKEVDS